MKTPEELGEDVTMEEVQEEFCSRGDVLSRAIGIIEDTQNQHKRGSMVIDVCWNLEIVRMMLIAISKNRNGKNREAA